MGDADTREISLTDLPALAKVARLDLAVDRQEVVAPSLEGILQLLDTLDAVEVGETPPTNSFDARWRDLCGGIYDVRSD